MRVDIDHSGIEQMSRDRGIATYLVGRGRTVQLIAKAIAPKRTLHYMSSIKVILQRRPSTVVFVAASDFKAHWIEWGAGPSPYRGWRPFHARRVLWRATVGAGLRPKRARKGEA
jgi:hypothetical protein